MENFKVGDKVIMTKQVGYLSEVGDVFTVSSIDTRTVRLRSLDGASGFTLDINTARKHFEKYEEPAKETIVKEEVDWFKKTF